MNKILNCIKAVLVLDHVCCKTLTHLQVLASYLNKFCMPVTDNTFLVCLNFSKKMYCMKYWCFKWNGGLFYLHIKKFVFGFLERKLCISYCHTWLAYANTYVSLVPYALTKVVSVATCNRSLRLGFSRTGCVPTNLYFAIACNHFV